MDIKLRAARQVWKRQDEPGPILKRGIRLTWKEGWEELFKDNYDSYTRRMKSERKAGSNNNAQEREGKKGASKGGD